MTATPRTRNKKPTFVVKESHNQNRVKRRWRFPRGRHSGVRQMHKGKPAMPNPGYGAPVAERGLHSSGLRPVLVHTLSQLEQVDPAVEGIIIASTVGTRKKVQLLEKAEQAKIQILNVKDVAATREGIQKAFTERQQKRKQKLDSKSKKEADKKKKAAEKEKEAVAEEKGSVEEKVQQEEEKQKKDVEKTITKRQ